MKKNIGFWLLFLIIVSLKLYGQEQNIIVEFEGKYQNPMPFSSLIKELNRPQAQAFKVALSTKLGSKIETSDSLKVMAGDENQSLTFFDKITTAALKSASKGVSKISIETLLKELEKNNSFKTALINSFKSPVKKEGSTSAIDDTNKVEGDDKVGEKKKIGKEEKEWQTLVTKIQSKLGSKKDTTINESTVNVRKDELKSIILSDNEKSILSYWWILFLFSIVISGIAVFWFTQNYIEKEIFKVIDKMFHHQAFSKMDSLSDFYMLSSKDLIKRLQVKDNKDNPDTQSVDSAIDELRKAIETKDAALQIWKGIAKGRTPEEIAEIVRKNDLQEDLKVRVPIPSYNEKSQSEYYYFSSANRGVDEGSFQDENKTSYKENSSLYRFEIDKDNPYQARFRFDADNPKNAITYRSYMVDPFCTSYNSYREGFTNIKHEGYGTAYLQNNKWIVQDKAKIRYE